jgi:hypothetical protein
MKHRPEAYAESKHGAEKKRIGGIRAMKKVTLYHNLG